MAETPPQFCPWCGKPRPNDERTCPSCGGASIKSVLCERAGVDALSFFGEDVASLLFDDQTGTYYVNPDKTRVKWQWLTGQLNNQFPFTVPANSRQKARVRINPEVGLRGDTEIASFLLTSSGRVAAQVYVPLLDKQLSNNLVPTSLMFGTAQLQALLASTLYCLPDFDWTIDFQDISGSDNTISPVFYGRRFLDSGDSRVEAARRAAGMSRFIHPYWLVPTSAFNNTTNAPIAPGPGNTIAIPGSNSVTVTFTVPSDADFDCRYILDDSSTSQGANTEINDLFAFIKEGAGGRDLVDAPAGSNGLSWRNLLASPTVPVTGFPSGGTNTSTGGIRAASLPSPAAGFTQLFKRGTDIMVTFFSTDSGTITLRTAFAGLLIYAAEPGKECAA
jgi:hypothetical protein